MLECPLHHEQDLRRLGQELAVAWRRGRAQYVLDSLSSEGPLPAALLAVIIHDLLTRWDPIKGEWPTRFWRAVASRSEGWLTDEEMHELCDRYRRQFGMSPPSLHSARSSPGGAQRHKQHREQLAHRIREALELGVPIPRQPSSEPTSPVFLRRQSASR